MDIVDLTQDNMLDYAGAVNQSRAIPDSRTGLKPIHRKIIYEMYADKIKSSGKFKKCAYMVGQIIARFSEHGDAATYDALVRLAQPWIQRYPLLDFHGNYGSQFGDPSAAMRYTESKLSSLVEDGMLEGLNKDNVDWMLNFTNEEKEPVTLPALFPGLFCLPNQGIGYACACNFLTMNLSEVIDGLQQYIKDGEFPVLQYDLASGGVIINPQIMEQIYRTGKGSVVVDAKYKIDGNNIIITEVPFNAMIDDLLDKIVELCEKDEVTGVVDVRNETGNGQLKIVIEVQNGVNPEDIMTVLFGKTKLRSSFGVNQVALVNNKPKLITQNEMAEIYVKHNLNCIKREYEFDLQKTEKRINILEGLVKALEDIDNVIALIKNSKSAALAKSALQDRYGFNDEQAKAILDMKLARLANLESVEVFNELAEKQEFADKCKAIIESDEKQKEILVERLSDLKNKYGDSRRTEICEKKIVKAAATKKAKEKVIEDVVITFSECGYLNNFKLIDYKKTTDKAFKITTQDIILLFSNKGKLYRISPEDIPQGKKKGIIANTILTGVDKDEKIIFATSVIVNEKHPYIIFVTKNGLVKKIDKAEHCVSSTRNLNGVTCMKLKDGDNIVFIEETNGDTITLYTKDKYAIKFMADEVRAAGKVARGVKGISLSDGDEVIKCTINENNNIKLQKRAGKGKQV